ncbi:MAG TPA: type II and III secretion system protein family protein [Pedomonas sp.]|uniref:type II and III secretion system protein family protein n=1 Tax=Pedomonas sp. TaxID=2976421 RepID=UPI002F42EA55
MRARRSLSRILPCVLAVLASGPAGIAPAGAGPSPDAARPAASVSIAVRAETGLHAGAFAVPLNKSQILTVERSYAQALIGNPAIADLMPLTDRSLYVLGKATGSTNLTLYDRNKTLIAVADLVVEPDVSGLRRQLGDLMPAEKISVRAANESVVLTGVLTSAPAVARAVQIAETYAPGKVVNMLSVGATQQVLLEVRISEMVRTLAKEIGINNAFISDSGNFFGGTGSNAIGTTLLTDEAGRPIVDLSGILDTFGIVGASFDIGSLNITTVLDALERKGILTTLAEPNLVALSGETASFLAGGEFPVPVAQNGLGGADSKGSSSITVEFKPFGVSLGFTPTVLEDGVINLVVAPEVSSIDPNASIRISGLTIPGLQTRRAQTTLELRDGQSFAIAGLIRNDFKDTVRQFPVLGSIPILGALFRSSGFQKQETELVIVVTPRLVKPTAPDKVALPTERVTPPAELDLFLNGRIDATQQNPGKDGLDANNR